MMIRDSFELSFSSQTTEMKMKNLQIKFSGQFLAIALLFSLGKAKKTCKPGQEDNVLQQFYHAARRKFTVSNILSFYWKFYLSLLQRLKVTEKVNFDMQNW